ncbi:sterol carrier family protein [Paenarthrobacter sp. GOM3]|uniref:sterol carrier family protein n=1 Tax=Paenarthrobacter sp. GOM3 TaxID=2782567 RepID=UPI001BA6AF6E|nr:sterol carrier family protein [Paenarthrobacter sp. GOM3]WOH17955.1 sterol carrier family protein [Paenarthrobacter sp. GOM3]
MAVARRRVDISEGRAALAGWQTAVERSETAGGAGTEAAAPPSRALIATAVRYSLEEVTARAPGNSVEVRVPPFGVTQCVEGPRHTRGTPPNVIECDAATWLALVTGRISWGEAVSSHKVTASGLRANLSELLPL